MKFGIFIPQGWRMDLVGIDPSLVVVMNPIYLDEITRDLARLGLSPAVEAL